MLNPYQHLPPIPGQLPSNHNDPTYHPDTRAHTDYTHHHDVNDPTAPTSCYYSVSADGTDLKRGEWHGSRSTSLEQCKDKATRAGVDYFAWSGQVYNGYYNGTAWHGGVLCMYAEECISGGQV